MKTFINKFFICLTLLTSIALANCNNTNEDFPLELTIQDKVVLLESGEWLLKGFETNVMHTFKAGKKYTFYGSDNVFLNEAIPGTQEYTISGEMLMINYNFGNITSYQLKFSCDNSIVKFYEDDNLNLTLYKRGSKYKSCL
ncbi:hypothetical protein FDT66_07945 [Polaribacter aestuariivivens]|uniref:Lipocalin-like domain-containing protein n=1 Tax=Polaribacter aestuariivivens TaxID=2304626 RepID=A0A5S3N804_9FLAO|nr:hypothetical protein [Polaribacter aestuariivivens]TMM30684.1 hypothetical protein FDT66_07945 [Polaribacter aestuariivivens]